MAELEPTIKNTDLKFNAFKAALENKKSIQIGFDSDLDTFFMFIISPLPETICHPVDDYVSLMFSEDSFEVIGIQIEHFDRIFLKKYSTLQKAWSLKESCADMDLKDLGDLMFKVEKQKEEVATAVEKVTRQIIVNQPKNADKYAYA